MANMIKFVSLNGIVSLPSDTPSVSTLLASVPGAYTTTRTHNNGKVIMFWERHLSRLANSAKILFYANPELLSRDRGRIDPFLISLMNTLNWESVIRTIVNDSMKKLVPMSLKERKGGDELSITTLVSANWENLEGTESIEVESVCKLFDVYMHVGMYAPAEFGTNGAHLAVVGRGRDVAEAKYSGWVRLRKPLESMRPTSANELLLSNDGDHILEGCVTNFFVVCRKDQNDSNYFVRGKNICDELYPFEIHTAPVRDGVLPGVIRQVIIDICSRNAIPLREVSPSWSQHEMWEEAFITSSLRLLQHVETIQVPTSWTSLQLRSLDNVTWAEKRFEDTPGRITAVIQKEILKAVGSEGYQVGMV